MRFIGNKEAITADISGLLHEISLYNKNLTLFDAFCGSGAVSVALSPYFNIIANDMLTWCVIYTHGRLCANECCFTKLRFNPCDYFNNSKDSTQGFFYKNYSPGGSQRMYFSAENAGRIDFFRAQIEEWNTKKLLTEGEYHYLLACLIESVSAVSNTAGVYGAFLKKWDARAKKAIKFIRVESNKIHDNSLPFNSGSFSFYNEKIEDIISNIDCDVLYLDPPYTQNQYGTQYHILETLVLNDIPEISRITGSRKTAPMRSDWSKEYKSHILFDYVIANTKAKYILFSYSSDGFMTKDYIDAVLKRYGKPETFVCKKISYKRYENFKTQSVKDYDEAKLHFEYLFFIEKKEKSEITYESPLNYTGSKSKMIVDIKRNMPTNVHEFIDVFGGGFNVGINIAAEKVVYNDINCYVKQLIESFAVYDTYQYLLFIKKITKKFGLKPAYSEGYAKAREYYNSFPLEKRDPRLLFTVILYGFQQQIRFNSNHDFNNPVGMRWFNNKIFEKLISFSRALKNKEIVFQSEDFAVLPFPAEKKCMFYMDPPYRLTIGSYNDGKRGFEGWTIEHEKKLFQFADALNKKGSPFMISYILEHGGKENVQFQLWIAENGYRVIEINAPPGRKRKEILVVNYGNK